MSADAIRTLIESAGYQLVDVPVLQPAGIVLDLTGEDLRRRLFITADETGKDYCLRPDFTIPVALAHIEHGAPERRINYGYCGPVFRQRPGESGEFWQAGIESLGRTDREMADAEVLALALDAARTGGLTTPLIQIGDAALFSAIATALGLAKGWQIRLKRLFGATDRVHNCLDEIANGCDPQKGSTIHHNVLTALAGANSQTVHDFVDDMLSITGVAPIGGRTAQEIAERFIEQAELTACSALGDDKIAVLRDVLALRDNPIQALIKIKRLASDADLAIEPVLKAFERRNEAMIKRGIELTDVTFAGNFGRRIDYYTGFVFEIHDEHMPAQGPLVGGGRYDELLRMLGSQANVPAVGAAIWLDRLIPKDLNIDPYDGGKFGS